MSGSGNVPHTSGEQKGFKDYREILQDRGEKTFEATKIELDDEAIRMMAGGTAIDLANNFKSNEQIAKEKKEAEQAEAARVEAQKPKGDFMDGWAARKTALKAPNSPVEGNQDQNAL